MPVERQVDLPFTRTRATIESPFQYSDGPKALAPAFVFNHQLTTPEQVNRAGVALQVADIGFKTGYGRAADAEHVKKLVVERLLIGAFGSGVTPLARKVNGAGFNFVPRQTRHDERSVRGKTVSVNSTLDTPITLKQMQLL